MNHLVQRLGYLLDKEESATPTQKRVIARIIASASGDVPRGEDLLIIEIFHGSADILGPGLGNKLSWILFVSLASPISQTSSRLMEIETARSAENR